MIPLTLHIKNFLSYGAAQTIHFGMYQLICLSGKNGHGKSALLDALTWVLWGQARKISGVAKSDAHLLRLGQTHMLVILDFLFNDMQYRVRREYSKSYGKSQANLDFGFLDPETQKMVSLTGKTIRDTQATIETTLGLDFESFINSAFLRQGQSNEFSKKSPKERKDILGAILGLHQYEHIKKRALDKCKQAQLQVRQYETLIQKLEAEVKELPAIEEQLTCISTKSADIAAHEAVLLQKTATFEEQKKQFLVLQQEYRHIQEHITASQEKITTAKNQVHSLRTTWKQYHAMKLSLPAVEMLNAQQAQLINRINEHQHTLQKTLELREKILQAQYQEQYQLQRIQKQYQEHRERYNQELHALSFRHTNLLSQKTALSERISHEQQTYTTTLQAIEYSKATLQRIHYPEELLQKAQKKLDKAVTYYHTWLSKQTILQESCAQLVHKRTLTEGQSLPSCPLCEQNVSGARKKFLRTKFLQEEYRIAYKLKRLNTALAYAQTTITECRQLVLTYQQDLQAHKQAEQEYQNTLVQSATQEKTLHTLKQELGAIEQELVIVETSLQAAHQQRDLYAAQQETLRNTDQAYKEIRDQLQKFQQELAALHYNQEDHTQAAQQLALLEQKKATCHSLKDQQAEQEQRKQRIFLLCRSIKADKAAVQALQEKLSQYTSLPQHAQELKQTFHELEREHQSLKTDKEEILHKKGQLEHAREKIHTYMQECAQYQKTIQDLQHTIFEYQAIATACSKDGIQALLIEEALPEIEQEANYLLARLTDNQAHIFMESLRDLQKGGTKETLDINISDAQGIRPYELFSGGEAFRIDFALRIAISKLLARRAGTCLQTLIIDEGFGSQDEEGLGHIMDALHKIQDNFRKIIIVSHLHTVKDQFPVHFYIEKGSHGSTVKVIEQG